MDFRGVEEVLAEEELPGAGKREEFRILPNRKSEDFALVIS